MELSPSQVVGEHPHLTMAKVYAALGYYWSHREEIHRDIENEEKLVAELKSKMGSSRIHQRLADLDAADDSIQWS